MGRNCYSGSSKKDVQTVEQAVQRDENLHPWRSSRLVWAALPNFWFGYRLRASGRFWAKFYCDSFAFWKLPPQSRSDVAQNSCGCRPGLWGEALVWYKVAVKRFDTRSKWTLGIEFPCQVPSVPQCGTCPFYFTCFLRQEHFSWSI